MKPIIITKKQAKFARYLAVRWLGKPGRYARICSIEKTREFFNEDGDGAAWSEREVPNDSASLEVNVYTVKGPALSYGFLGQALSLLGLTRYDQTDHIANPIPPKTEPVPPELQPPPAEPVAAPMSLRNKLSKCATMRLARKFGMDPNTEFGDIVKERGDAAVIAYQEILSKVPTYGMTEARLKFAFPAEYALL